MAPRVGLDAWKESRSLPGCLLPVAAASRGGGGQPGLEYAHLSLSLGDGAGVQQRPEPQLPAPLSQRPCFVTESSFFFFDLQLVVINGTLWFLMQKQGHGEDTVVLKPQ